MSRWIPLVIFFAVAGVLFTGLSPDRDPRRVPSPLIGKPVPNFSTADLHQASETLSNRIFVGKISLLNFWATWCAGCIEEHPILVQIANHNDVQLIGMNHKDERDKALAWLARHGDPYRRSGFDDDGRVGLDLGVYGLPETYLVDQQGIILYKHIGPVRPGDWETKFKPLIVALDDRAAAARNRK